jgi:hypothetical protein
VVEGQGVRRRIPDVDPDLPARLVSFRLTEWPDAQCPHEAVRMWEYACMDWLAAGSNREPRPGAGERFNRCWLSADSNRVLPVGDALDLLREVSRLRNTYPPCPEEGRPAQWTGNEVRHA